MPCGPHEVDISVFKVRSETPFANSVPRTTTSRPKSLHPHVNRLYDVSELSLLNLNSHRAYNPSFLPEVRPAIGLESSDYNSGFGEIEPNNSRRIYHNYYERYCIASTTDRKKCVPPTLLVSDSRGQSIAANKVVMLDGSRDEVRC